MVRIFNTNLYKDICIVKRAILPGIISIILFALFVLPAAPQEYNYEVQTIPLKGEFINFSGLCFMQDRDGFMWFGSTEGLYRYHGTSVKVYRHVYDNENSLSDNYVYDLYEDSEGVIWIGTRDGLNRFDKYTETFKCFRHNNKDITSIVCGQITKITEDKYQNLWIATQCGFSRFDRKTETFKNYEIKIEESAAIKDPYQIWGMDPDNEGHLWLCSDDGVYRLDIPSGNLEQINFTKDDFAWEVYIDKSGRCWFICYRGLYLYNIKQQTFKRFIVESKYSNKPERQSMRTMFEDVAGNIWIRTFDGIYCYNQELELRYSLEHSLPENYETQGLTKEMIIDNTGSIWYYSLEGINQIINKGRNFRTYDSDILINTWVNSIYLENKDLIWFGTLHGINSLDRSKNDYQLYYGDTIWKSGYPHQALTMYPDREGTIWIGMWTEGLLSMVKSENGKRQLRRHLPESADSNKLKEMGLYSIRNIFEDSGGRLWISDRGMRFLQYYDRLENTMIRLVDNPSAKHRLPEKSVIRHQTGSDTLWAIGSSGINKIILPLIKISDDKIIPTDVIKCQLFDDTGQETSIPPVNVSYMDSSGNIWLGTHNHGFLKITEKRIQGMDANAYKMNSYTTSEGLPADKVLSILPDGKGNLWIGTNNGLTKFNIRSGNFTNYFVRHGLPVNEFRRRSAAIGDDGELFFGTIDGIISFYPDSVYINQHVASVMITGIRINNQPLHPGKNNEAINSICYADKIELHHNQDNISIEYAILNYNNPELNQYRYKLEGFNDDWVYAGNRTKVDFTNLDPGKYTLLVSGSNNDGIWNEEGKSLSIIIHLPLWQTWYAYLVYGLILTWIILWYRQFLRNRSKLRLAIEVEKVEKEKILELDQMKSRFFANISHEFRTPLSLLIGPIEDAMKQGQEKIEVSKGIISMMYRNARRLHNLINQLLDISRIESGKMKLQLMKANLSEFVRVIASSFYSLAESRQIQYQIDIKPDGEDSCFDGDKTEKIIMNLLSNAFKFCEDRGYVALELGFVNPVNENYRQAVMKVKDNGKGIEQDQLDKIFDRFYQVSDNDTRLVEGSGIGLALTRELLELMHGSIEVESTPGKGTTFQVTFPISEGSFSKQEIETMIVRESLVENETVHEIEQSILPENAAVIQGAEVILVVEDNPDLRWYIIEKFSEQYKVIEAEDGDMGLRKAIEQVPDLVITDLMMPVMGGIEFCRKLKEHPAINHIPVIMLTAKSDKDSRIEGLEAAADDYISKPFDTDLLLARVRNLISQRNELRNHFKKEFLLSGDEEDASTPLFRNLREIMKMIDEHIDDPDFHLDSMASLLNMSRRGIFRKTKAIAGMTPHVLLRLMRMKRAAALLRKGELNVTEVMYRVGMNNLSNFALCFRKYFGVNPGEYRNREMR